LPLADAVPKQIRGGGDKIMKLSSGGFYRALFKVFALFGIVAGGILAEAAPAKAQQVVYLFIGVTDDGGVANAGVATSVHCANFSGATQTLTVVAVNSAGAPLNLGGTTNKSVSATVTAGQVITFSTHPTTIFQDAGTASNLQTGFVGQGAIGILSTSTNVACTAMIMDAASASPQGISLNPLRFNPIPGTME
jgi:hypothetical protein